MVYSEVDPVMHAAISGGNLRSRRRRHQQPETRTQVFSGQRHGFRSGCTGRARSDRFRRRHGQDADPGSSMPDMSCMCRSSPTPTSLWWPRTATPVLTRRSSTAWRCRPARLYDVMLTPAGEGRYAVHDAALHLTNDGTSRPRVACWPTWMWWLPAWLISMVTVR